MQKITPCLWYNDQTEDALNRLISYFPNSKIETIQRYPDGLMPGMDGKIITAIFELAGQSFMALDGGPTFNFTPAISFFINGDSVAEIDRLWEQLSVEGAALMPIGDYGFSEKFGWLNDRDGVSWQLNVGARPQKITPYLLFVGEQHGKAEEAIQFYTSIFADSSIEYITHHTGEMGEAGTVLTSLFRLNGQEFMAMDSNLEHNFTFTEATSFYVECDTQAEVDHFWNALSAVPDAEQCGWLKDKYGISWQIVPRVLGELLSDPDAEKANRVMDAMLQMKKIEIDGLMQAV